MKSSQRKNIPFLKQALLPLAALLLLLNSCAPSRPPAKIEGVYLPDTLNDPAEPLNRGIWALNEGVLRGVIHPTSRGYRMVVPAPARTSIKNFGYNLGYPGRAINQVLQGRMSDAGDESVRFVTNTTVGLLGFFDVASKWNIPKHRGGFGQTFKVWGWDGDNYVVLPFLGPSDEVSALGAGVDVYAHPLVHTEDGYLPLYAVTYNRLSMEAEDMVRLLDTDPDAYDSAKIYWTYSSKIEAPDWSLKGPIHRPSLETMAVSTLTLQDEKFVERAREAKVKVPTTGRKLSFNYWIRDEKSPLVYIMPGLGSHRMSMQALVVAEGLYNNGYSVVTISGSFHPEFIKNASSNGLPGSVTAERRDLWSFMGSIDAWLERKHGDKLTNRGMVGISMGGFQALAMSNEDRSAIKPVGKDGKVFAMDQFLAINPPVNLMSSLERLENYQKAPEQWPESVRQERVNNAVHKAVALMRMPEADMKDMAVFDEIESKYLVGIWFRLTLRNAIYASQKHHKLGNLDRPLSWWNRRETYHEILGISYDDYLNDIVLPHFKEEGISEAQLRAESDLKRLAPGLAKRSNSHIITTQNDFIVSSADRAWMRRTFGSRLMMGKSGGHVGNLANPKIHDHIADKLSRLKGK